MLIKLKLENEYEVEAEDFDDALEKLAERFDIENMTAETEFWNSLEELK